MALPTLALIHSWRKTKFSYRHATSCALTFHASLRFWSQCLQCPTSLCHRRHMPSLIRSCGFILRTPFSKMASSMNGAAPCMPLMLTNLDICLVIVSRIGNRNVHLPWIILCVSIFCQPVTSWTRYRCSSATHVRKPWIALQLT
jgi:hypothetical protein